METKEVKLEEIKEVNLEGDIKGEDVWKEFEKDTSETKLKLEKNEEYKIGISSIGFKKLYFDNPDGTSREVPTLILYLDFLNGEEVEKELWVTSKKLIKVIKMFYDSGELHNKIFRVIKMGEGFQTEYVFSPIKDKDS